MTKIIRMQGRGLQGRSWADVARATGAYGALSDDTDQEVLDRVVGDIAAATMATSHLYEDTVSGLAATGDGDYFSVPDSGDDFVILYQNDSGTAVEINRYPAKPAVIFNDPLGTYGVVHDIAPKTSVLASMNGVVSGSTADQSSALNALFAACALVGATAVIDVPAVYAESHLDAACSIHFNSGCWIVDNMTTAGSDDYLIDVTDDDLTISATGFGMAGVRAISEDRKRWGFRILGYRQNITLANIWAKNLCRTYCTTDAATWGDVSFGSNTPTNIRIRGGGCRFDGATLTGAPTTGADFLGYCDGAVVDGGEYRNVPQGVQFWGGNAATPGVGDDGLERKCRGIRISNCDLNIALSGAFWGACGTDVLIENCTAHTVGDVAFDAEGCTDTEFSGVKAVNAKKGGFATFFQCNGVSFKSSTSTSTDNTITRLVSINNSTNLLTNRNISLLSCTFRAVGYVSLFAGVGDHVNAVKNLNVISCVFENCNFDAAGTNSFSQRIVGCSFTWDKALSGTRPVAIRLDGVINDGSNGPLLVFEGNVVRSFASNPSESVGVLLSARGVGAPATVDCSGNKIAGFAIPISCYAQGSNVGISQTFMLDDNKTDVNAIGRPTSTFTAVAATDIITATALLRAETGTRVRLTTTGTLPAPLAAATDYWLIRVSQTTFKIATSSANATAGTAIDITDVGTGTHSIVMGRNTSTAVLTGNKTFAGAAIT